MPQLNRTTEKKFNKVSRKHFHRRPYSIVSIVKPENGASKAKPADKVQDINRGLSNFCRYHL
jgi:hypothetical protein